MQNTNEEKYVRQGYSGSSYIYIRPILGAVSDEREEGLNCNSEPANHGIPLSHLTRLTMEYSIYRTT
jgi:hypothetical protein